MVKAELPCSCHFSEEENIIQRTWIIICFIVIISLLGLAGIALKQYYPVETTTDQQPIIVKSQVTSERRDQSANANESRSDFTAKVIANPQKIDWTGAVLFDKVMRYMDEPQTNIQQLFDEKINYLNLEEYYAGSYYLQDGLYCELIWISNKDHLSLGFKISGLTPNVKTLENVIEAKLNKPSKEIYQENYYMKGWYNKIYNNMNYDIEYSHYTDNDQSTLMMNVHPYVYH
jgi:hypothetical protein